MKTNHPRFNPTLVRLRPPELRSSPHTIKWFQSHAGSIEAHTAGSPEVHPHASFNPTLVRLRQVLPCLCLASLPGFNPTLVRLRPTTTGMADGPSDGFQSHAGSIEACRHWEIKKAIFEVSIPRWFD